MACATQNAGVTAKPWPAVRDICADHSRDARLAVRRNVLLGAGPHRPGDRRGYRVWHQLAARDLLVLLRPATVDAHDRASVGRRAARRLTGPGDHPHGGHRLVDRGPGGQAGPVIRFGTPGFFPPLWLG